jgi:hypothetical protein
MATPNVFPTPPSNVLSALVAIFKTQKEHRLAEILSDCTARIEEDSSGYGNYNDNTIVWNLYIEVPPEMYGEYEASFEKVEKMIEQKLPAISRGAAGDNWIKSASFAVQMSQVNSPLPQDEKAIGRIWKPGMFRLFISHRTEDKLEITTLKDELASYGIFGFVAHKDIEVNQEWEREIRYGLNSMQALVAIVTPEFHKSHWTNQEIGIALGRGVLVTSIRAGSDPKGFTASIQGMPGNLDHPQSLALAIVDALLKHPSTSLQMREALIEGLLHSGSYNVTIACFNRLIKLGEITKKEAEHLQKAFENSQVDTCVAVAGKLKLLIQKHYPRFLEVKGPPLPDDDDIPF